jgi:hypothetical protein
LPFHISFIANIARKRPELKQGKTTLVMTGFFAAGCPKSSKVIVPLMPAILAGVPLTFALHLDACAINEQVRWALEGTIRQFPTSALWWPPKRAEIRHLPV